MVQAAPTSADVPDASIQQKNIQIPITHDYLKTDLSTAIRCECYSNLCNTADVPNSRSRHTLSFSDLYSRRCVCYCTCQKWSVQVEPMPLVKRDGETYEVDDGQE
ncbi:hypothetical protein L596_028577 [Steinernema carpocapsae]|uniref:Uncharacterized protein n=1 Tax=Steinernema carpocapsae TaxID=34508 RepID=A0A4U5LZS8_STECR|nr:hypothetical protein L596_028577 [Steinernema carpocapsae]